MRSDLAVDGGQSGLRVAVVERHEVVRTVRTEGFRYAAAADGVAHDADALVASLKGVAAQPRRVVLGLTNAPGTPDGRVRLAEAVRQAIGAEDVLVTGDMVAAHAGALGGADGVVVAAGTGAVAFGRRGTAHARSDGFGYLLGDDGSGFAVGRDGLRAALRALEGRGPATSLVAAMRERFADVPDFPHALYRRPDVVEVIAGFSPDVATAADTGDAVARAIWSDAVEALVRSVSSVVARCPGLVESGNFPVSFTGGLFAVDRHLRQPFERRLPVVVTGAVPTPPLGDALAGAVHLLRGDPGYGELVGRSTMVPA